MPAPKWLVVAKNEYRVYTSRIRGIRPYFPYLAIGLLAVYVLFIAPAVIGLFIDDLLVFFLSQVAIAMVQIILFMIFVYFTIFPITNTLKDTQTELLELFLAAPIKPSDVLLGEFLGQMPFYAIAVTVIAGLFTAILAPLGLDVVQMAVIIIIFAVTFFSAQWIGTVIAALLRTRLGKTARGRDIGKALALVMALPMIALMYSMMGGSLLETLANPGTSGMVQAVLGWLPSSWGAEVIVGFASNLGNISAVGLETLTRFGGLVVFFVASLWLGLKAANRAYSLEPTTFIASRAMPDGAFYKIIRYLGGGGSFGTLLVSVFKNYGRRLENISKIAYVVGLLILMNIFLGDPEHPQYMVLEVAPLIFSVLAVFVVGEVTLRGKEGLFIYRKAPSGVGRLVKARLLHGLLVLVPITVTITAVRTILIPSATLISVLTNIGIIVLIVAANVVLALGLSLLNPAFTAKSGNFMVNVMIVPQLGFVILIISGSNWGLYVPLIWFVGIVFLYLEARKLRNIE
ncbi:hypothetical protein H8D40_05190 [Candidatus Bathyarchaeota archaeon]|nr:hypothetical protein [Candidatus Bathyarchaeota archaeon]